MIWVCLKHSEIWVPPKLVLNHPTILLPLEIEVFGVYPISDRNVFLSAAWDQRAVAVAKGHLPHQVQHNHHIPRHATVGHA